MPITVGVCCSVAKVAFTVANEVYSRITELAENNAYRQSIVKYIEKLRGIADELSRMENENFPGFPQIPI